jgi:hypothetical protein
MVAGRVEFWHVAAIGLEGPGGNLILNAQRLIRGLQLPLRGLRALQVSRMMGVLTRLHLSSVTSVVGSQGPVVSLTSYGERVKTVHLVIESIARGSLLPSRLILWLDDESLFHNLPESLIRLYRRGLEVRLSKNYGPHTKYYPYLESCQDFRLPLVTADDDILYPVFWLQRLAQANAERPDLINCYRARVIALQAKGLAPYDDWRLCHSSEPTIRHLATGVSGVIYPPEFLEALKQAGAAFQTCCPEADDLWLHVQALRSEYQVRQFVKDFVDFPMIPGTQQIGLYKSNCGEQGAGNDRQAAITYNQQDLDILSRTARKRPLRSGGRFDQKCEPSDAY